MRVYQANRLGPFVGIERTRILPFVALLLCIGAAIVCAQSSAQTAPATKTPPALGTIRSINGNVLTLATDSGAELKVQLPPELKVLRVPPGSKDLKEATPIQLSDLQAGDRILVRGKPGDDGSSYVATTIVAMKKADIAVKQEKDREEWQRHGIGGLVSAVDPAQNTIIIKTLTPGGTKEISVHASNTTVLRRYAPGSVNFDEAKVAPITEIQPGDQLRARGKRSADGAEFTADEIVSGSFRNIAGVITGVNATAGTLILNDLATKKPVELKVTPESQMRKLPQPMAQRIAIRLKGADAEGNGAAAATGKPGGLPPATAGRSAGADSASPGAAGVPRNGGGNGGGGDLQQMLSRLPVSPLSGFQKGDAVMVVATSGQADGPSTVITLLGGVEPILQSSQGQASSILTPWSLSQGGGGDAGTP
jgi:hypothetical protein